MKIRNLKKRIGTLAVAVAALSATAPAAAQEFYLGQVLLMGTNFCPRGTADAAGQLLTIANYNALFSLYGTMYGGDGRTTFGLPDLRGRVTISQGQGPGLPNYPAQGAKGGVTSVTLNTTTLPAHNHGASTSVTVNSTLMGSSAAANSQVPTGNALADADRNTYLNVAPGEAMHSGSISNTATATTTVNQTGSSRSFSVQSPYQVLRYCVVLQGIFPSRN